MRTITRARYSYVVPAGGVVDIPADEAASSALLVPSLDGMNRKNRRRAKVFNRLLSRRLAKEGTVAVLPDGGVHVTVGKPADED